MCQRNIIHALAVGVLLLLCSAGTVLADGSRSRDGFSDNLSKLIALLVVSSLCGGGAAAKKQ